VCSQIAQDIRQRYTIGYVPPEQGKPVRHIKVEAFSENHKKLVVRTRTSYLYAPDTKEAKPEEAKKR